jgi:hypothetical protein
VEPPVTSPEDVQRLLAVETLRRFGSLRIRVLGSSMLPSLWPGDEVTVAAVVPEQLQRHDLVMFTRDGSIGVHRFLGPAGKGADEVLTHGDAMPGPDEPLLPEQTLGRVVSIRRAGRSLEPQRSRAWLHRAVGNVLCRNDRLRGLALRLHAARCRAVNDAGRP